MTVGALSVFGLDESFHHAAKKLQTAETLSLPCLPPPPLPPHTRTMDL